jgi:branched-chain amino acid transport system substrate-binding protein
MNCFKRTTAMTFVIAVVLSVVPAFAAEPGVTDNEIKLGADSVQSGPKAAYGVTQRTMKAYFDMINEHGGVNGRKINYLVKDNADSGQQALQVVKKLVEDDNVFALVGSGTNHNTTLHYLRENKIPDLWIMDPLPIFTEPMAKTTFAVSPNMSMEATFYADYILKHFAGKKIGILIANNDYGHSALEAFKKEIGDKAKILVEESDIRTEPIAKAQILNLKKEGVEVLYTTLPLPGFPATLNFAKEQGFKPQWFLAFYNSHSAVLKLSNKEALEGAITWYYTYTDLDTDNAAVKKHLEFMKKYAPNDKPSTVTLGAQAAAEVTIETLKRAGKNLTREGLLKAAESFKDWQCTVCRTPSSTSATNHSFITKSNVTLLVAHDGRWQQYEKAEGKKEKRKRK